MENYTTSNNQITTTIAEDINTNTTNTSTDFQSMNLFSPSTTLDPQQCYFQSPHIQNPQFPGQYFAAYLPIYPFQFGDQNGVEIGATAAAAGPNGLTTKVQQRGCMDPQKTKIARIKRKIARIRAINSQRNASSSVSSSSNQSDSRRSSLSMSVAHNRDLYNFFTPDNKRLRVLLKKQLKNSDVGNLGRIVLPKREVEENLPSLSDKEGIKIVMSDIYSDQVWTLKFKYWSNNRSRMYVLENTGDFVKQNGLESGDSLALYEDESMNLYFSIEKVGKPAANQPSNNIQISYNILNTVPPSPPSLMNEARDELEEASLALLIQQLNQKEQEEEANYNFITSSSSSAAAAAAPPIMDYEEANDVGPCSTTTHNISTHDQDLGNQYHPHLVQPQVDEYNNTTDHDCYGGLEMLPDVNKYYNFSL
ncbi:hypothetical protein LWI28_014608 [Acer negundo]|uniref:TF-B3 domain-containing protein n=1 Tax=Acer negundo TaxID=4023 RepID=A0AAD5JFQ9_ACENE|nr:hypothetical protein LWI28_014608 [Acer negundo]KAK4858728.1 hypothetical protein QYF36_021137 [Acer negundo]